MIPKMIVQYLLAHFTRFRNNTLQPLNNFLTFA